MKEIPDSHPRAASLRTRNKIVDGVKRGITSVHGLIAQGRGEAFDYLVGEKTNNFAKRSIDAAAAMLLLAKHPILSINGNVCILTPKEIVSLSKAVPCVIEVNIFHSSRSREVKIQKYLLKHGAEEVLLPKKKLIKGIDHNRSFCNPDGIYRSDVVFVPLEDGDRCKALRDMKKKVITIDLNPLSRTAKTANITIVDNITRAMPLLIERVAELKRLDKNKLEKIVKDYNNKNNNADISFKKH